MVRALLSKIQVHRFTLLSSCIAICVFLLLTAPALFQPSHLLYNLEPYPDGLLYALSARNVVLDRSFALVYQDSVLPYWTPPLYSFILILGYYLNDAPQTFYLVNLVLGCLTILVLTVGVAVITKNKYLPLVAAAIYISHAYVVWLPTVPMAENISLLLFSCALILLLLPKKISFGMAVAIIAAATGLVLTKFAAIALLGAIGMLLVIRLLQEKSYRVLAVLSGGFCVVLLGVTILRGNPFAMFNFNLIQNILLGTNQFFSTAFIQPNFAGYLLGIVTTQSNFLWLQTPLSSLFAAVAFLLSGLYLWKSKKSWGKSQAITLSTLFVAQLSIMLVFYVIDTRYIIFTIPLFTVGSVLLLNQLQHKLDLKVLVVLGGIFLLGHLFTQKPLFKEILIANVLGRTVAWQYESIQHFNRFAAQTNLASENTDSTEQSNSTSELLLITALPPFLVDAYQTTPYRVLPLSQSQEFLQKGEYVWGSDVPYDNLLEGYTQWLADGKELYITNAYITHQQAVIADYEQYADQFRFELVSSGCMDACNIYRITLN